MQIIRIQSSKTFEQIYAAIVAGVSADGEKYEVTTDKDGVICWRKNWAWATFDYSGDTRELEIIIKFNHSGVNEYRISRCRNIFTDKRYVKIVYDGDYDHFLTDKLLPDLGIKLSGTELVRSDISPQNIMLKDFVLMMERLNGYRIMPRRAGKIEQAVEGHPPALQKFLK